jgi:FlaA1/EpsC-like NDP-sugar epimerase
MNGLFLVRRGSVVLLNLALIAAANYLALWLRFDGTIPDREMLVCWQTLPWLLLIRGGMFVPFRLYGSLWRYTGMWDLRNILAAIGSSTVIFYVLVRWVLGIGTYPRSVFIIDFILLVFFIGGIRLATRLPRGLQRPRGKKRVLIFGAGDAGEMVVRDMRRYPDHEPVGFIDDDVSKRGQWIHGVQVLGTRSDLPRIIQNEAPNEVLVAVPRADPAVMRELVRALQPFKVPITTLPNLREIIDGKVTLKQIRSLSIEDLLARAPVGLDMAAVRQLIAGKRVMVTGAGGSIGAELCRQIAPLGPENLVLFERYENGLYAVANDLAELGLTVPIFPIIGDITDEKRLTSVVAEHRPQIIFHAAAHKHVPLMESNVCEAIKNNVIGTRMVMEAAERYEVERFVLISTDKAVNPSSVMGTTKRVAELMLQSQNQTGRTQFVAVRFGNVLGSNGSVVPRFVSQIKSGGPVTVTHPDIRRYFMMIPEAVVLVLQAAASGRGGDLFVLDMGEQIKVLDLARNLIRLSGFVPDEDIPISFTGLRPGEKLYEELAGSGETLEKSGVEKILYVRSHCAVVPALLSYQIWELERAAVRGDGSAVLEQLSEIVPACDLGRDLAERGRVSHRREKRRKMVVSRRVSNETGFEYVQVAEDRRSLALPDRRREPRGGRRLDDRPERVLRKPSVSARNHTDRPQTKTI